MRAPRQSSFYARDAPPPFRHRSPEAGGKGEASATRQGNPDMGSKMLIDATHPEETRVVVVRGNRIEDFDFESAARKQLKGNIYLAKVTRVEPSLQAAFVDYGGNRHGFLAFSEIHPDYYQIPIADRQALLAADEEDARRGDEEYEAQEDARAARGNGGGNGGSGGARGRGRSKASSRGGRRDQVASEPVDGEIEQISTLEAGQEHEEHHAHDDHGDDGHGHDDQGHEAHDHHDHGHDERHDDDHEDHEDHAHDDHSPEAHEPAPQGDERTDEQPETVQASTEENSDDGVETVDQDPEAQIVESVGAEDAMEELPQPRRTHRRHYKIQEVIKRRQVILVQVVKEERGNKGAALTTYLSLAGRYCVLMPNSGRGGGVSRKITDSGDRRRLKEVAREVEVPEGMGLIVRTAGAQRTKTEIKRDFDYLLRLWESVRDLTLSSSAPSLVYEEGSLIKRAIRDLYSKDVEEVLVEGDEGLREAKDFMKMLMPSHARNVKPWKETRPLFTRHQVESQLDGLFSPTVTLPSGGYMVMNQTEALVAIDINSGKSTREHNIEDTAYKTNLEACDEIARQLRLRDLAGLIVIDFIDMEEKRNNRNVERRIKDALKNDRARIQVGRISHFGLLEMSRQRLRQGMLEGSTKVCPHCEGRGIIRSVSSCALSVLRQIEDQLTGRKAENLTVHCHREIATYILNEKREHLLQIEGAYGISIFIVPSDSVKAAEAIIERGAERAVPVRRIATPPKVTSADEYEAEEAHVEDESDDEEFEDDPSEQSGSDGRESSSGPVELDENGEPRRKRRRRRGRRGGRRGREEGQAGAEGEAGEASADDNEPSDIGADGTAWDGDVEAAEALLGGDAAGSSEEPARRRRRRGGRNRRGGRGDREGNGASARADGEAPVGAASDAPDDEDVVPVFRERAPAPVAVAEIFAPVMDTPTPVAPAPEKIAEAVDQPTAEEVARRWQPPAPTVDPEAVPRKKGWWSKK
jgi:ribonuclease E